ncbi:hypothetical protein LX32DRAFT_89469 [Colletotrichum zoysiae]|uniref:Uncharacterized protein n=1 Tax=Colletotrichum zoysiae TaxID=1216348 RepID=A0AAD9HSF3_9PEZI|nr:hypothetical protein LX32DRAFT_89469 [Colletotrichum zoysiae]
MSSACIRMPVTTHAKEKRFLVRVKLCDKFLLPWPGLGFLATQTNPSARVCILHLDGHTLQPDLLASERASGWSHLCPPEATLHLCIRVLGVCISSNFTPQRLLEAGPVLLMRRRKRKNRFSMCKAMDELLTAMLWKHKPPWPRACLPGLWPTTSATGMSLETGGFRTSVFVGVHLPYQSR